MSGAELTNPHIDPLVDKVAQILHTHVEHPQSSSLCSCDRHRSYLSGWGRLYHAAELVIAEVRSSAPYIEDKV